MDDIDTDPNITNEDFMKLIGYLDNSDRPVFSKQPEHISFNNEIDYGIYHQTIPNNFQYQDVPIQQNYNLNNLPPQYQQDHYQFGINPSVPIQKYLPANIQNPQPNHHNIHLNSQQQMQQHQQIRQPPPQIIQQPLPPQIIQQSPYPQQQYQQYQAQPQVHSPQPPVHSQPISQNLSPQPVYYNGNQQVPSPVSPQNQRTIPIPNSQSNQIPQANSQNYWIKSSPSTQQYSPDNDVQSPNNPAKHKEASRSSESIQLPEIQQPHHQLLTDIQQLHMRQKETLESMRQLQKQCMLNPQKQTFEMLESQQSRLHGEIENEIQAMHQLFNQVILAPADIQQHAQLSQELKILKTQVQLFRQELQQLTLPQQRQNRCIAALLITEQPFPLVITKGKQLDDDPLVVQLLSGTNLDLHSFSKVNASVVWENHQTKGQSTTAQQKTLDTDAQVMDGYRRVSRWNLKFSNGTRKNSISLRFTIQLQIGAPHILPAVAVESETSNPFIVITNECQWEEAEGLLIKKEVFGELPDKEWAHFANVLQRHFLRATRQDPVKPTRCLSMTDFFYLHEKFFGNADKISSKDFESFWSWFGKGMQKLRYQRHLCPLWLSGLLYGLVSRDDVHNALIDADPGSFLIRLSERHPGSFAVAYRVDDPDPNNRVRHYLIKPDDTAGSKKTLPDFLADQPTFSKLLQVVITSFDQRPTLYTHHKDIVLDQYYSKRNVVTTVNGYDETIPRNSVGAPSTPTGSDDEDAYEM